MSGSLVATPLERKGSVVGVIAIGRSREAREWLESGAESGALPRKAHLLADTDLDAVRSEPWFAALVARAGD